MMMIMMIIISIHWIYNPFIISIHDDDDDAMANSCSDRLCMNDLFVHAYPVEAFCTICSYDG